MFGIKLPPTASETQGRILRVLIDLEYKRQGEPRPTDDELLDDVLKQLEEWSK